MVVTTESHPASFVSVMTVVPVSAGLHEVPVTVMASPGSSAVIVVTIESQPNVEVNVSTTVPVSAGLQLASLMVVE